MLKQEKFPNGRKYTIKPGRTTNVSTSLRHATGILACLSNDINTITDIAGYCRYSTSTVHRLLGDLKELGWIVQDGDSRKYFLGPLLTRLAAKKIAAHKYLILHALREMERLAEITEETVNLGVMVQMHHTLLHEISSQHHLKITDDSQKLEQQFNGAAAKVLLSQLPPEELKTALKQITVVSATAKTMTDKYKLLGQLEEIRRVGYCITRGERVPGAVCISAPVKNYIYPVHLSIVGPDIRLDPMVKEFLEELKAGASRISSDIAEAFAEKEVTQVKKTVCEQIPGYLK